MLNRRKILAAGAASLLSSVCYGVGIYKEKRDVWSETFDAKFADMYELSKDRVGKYNPSKKYRLINEEYDITGGMEFFRIDEYPFPDLDDQIHKQLVDFRRLAKSTIYVYYYDDFKYRSITMSEIKYDRLLVSNTVSLGIIGSPSYLTTNYNIAELKLPPLNFGNCLAC